MVPRLAACGLARICARARGKGDLRSALPAPNVLPLTPLHAFPEVSLHFGELSARRAPTETAVKGGSVEDRREMSKSLQKLYRGSQQDSDKLVCIPLTY